MNLNWKTEMLLAIILSVLVFLIFCLIQSVRAEDAWILCQPDSWVNIREKPGNGKKTGYLEIGQKITLDGTRRAGYAHITDANTESGEGWVSTAYIVMDPPMVESVRAWVDADGRVACRRSIGGNRRKWLRGGDELILYASSAEWSVTSEGFIQSQYIIAER